MLLQGSIVALITPMTPEGAIDWEAFARLIDWQIAEGTAGLVPCGTTGESATLSHAEHDAVVKFVIHRAAGRVPVIAGTGSNNTLEAVALTREAEAAGATAALVITPYYNKPTQEGLYQHFKAIHDATTLPILLYDVPGRTVTRIADETVARLAALPRVLGIKDATADLTRPVDLAARVPADFVQLSGEDGTVLAYLVQGGHGCISVTANVAPRLCAALHQAWQAGDLAEAQRINRLLMPLHHAMFCETNPGPVKYAAHLLGVCSNTVRLPLVPIGDDSARRIRAVMEQVGLV
jgi:4-hydroxy-tetrahydrodipicolinate synthase